MVYFNLFPFQSKPPLPENRKKANEKNIPVGSKQLVGQKSEDLSMGEEEFFSACESFDNHEGKIKFLMHH